MAGHDQANFPLFYQALRPIGPIEDGDKFLRHRGFAFARRTRVIPLYIHEIPEASSHFPIVFSGDSNPVLLAVVGLNPEDNLFVDEEGKWLLGAYLPHYLRRYPFMMRSNSENLQSVLCVDDESGFLNQVQGERLFENGEPSTLLTGIMVYCDKLINSEASSREFIEALIRWELLVEVSVQIETGGGTLRIDGLRTISREKLDRIDDNVILTWHRRGWLAAVYAMQLSSHRWTALKVLLERRLGASESTLPTASQPEADAALAPGSGQAPSLREEAIGVRVRKGFRLAKRPGSGRDF